MNYLLSYIAVMGCSIGIAFALTASRSPAFKFVWYDLWVGAYWDRTKRWLYILPLPCVVFVFDFGQPGDILGERKA